MIEELISVLQVLALWTVLKEWI